jgi:NAD(P)-dependent dehydrogenase (short-subunit alcohol dehydrogenase family)
LPKGARVAIFDMNAERGNMVAGGIDGLYCQADVTDEESVDAALAAARAAHGQERILVNCAGIAIGQKTAARDRKTGAIEPHPLASFSRVIAVNLIGTFHMIAKCAAGMLSLDPVTPDGGRGVIVNTASVAATDGQIGQAAYAASKGGVASLTLPVARDLARDGIRCVTILPGLFATPMVDGLPEDVRQALGDSIPFPSRLGRPPNMPASWPISSTTTCSTARPSASTAPCAWPRGRAPPVILRRVRRDRGTQIAAGLLGGPVKPAMT